MPYTRLSLALVWLLGVAAVAASASGAATNGALVVLVLMALTLPSFVLRLSPTLAPAGAPPMRRTD